MSKEISAEKLLEELHGFYGTEKYHKYNMFSSSVMTDGVKYLADQAGLYWLLDVIDSYKAAYTHEEFLCTTLTVDEHSGATVTITDGNERVFADQKIPFTDCILQEVKLFSGVATGGAWVHMLPSEY